MTERYKIFFDKFSKQPNWQYVIFISSMKKLYLGGAPSKSIRDHDDFTRFIKDNVSGYVLPD